MAYRLNYTDVLKANFIPFDPVMYIILIGFPVGVLLMFLFRKKMSDKLGYSWIVLFIAAIMPIILMFLTDISQVGAGWRIENGKLMIKTYSGSDTLDIQNIKVSLADISSPWRPVTRINGYGTPGLGTGRYNLKNGKKAVVFRHMGSPQMVVLEYNNSYYVISHPGVEELYQSLIAQGAKPAEL
ncbi:MAG: hypothetical protein ACOY31_01425 [Bacillota bacterium]